MKFKSSWISLAFIALICSISTASFAQTAADSAQTLQGVWQYESIVAIEGNVQQKISLEDLCCQMPLEMDIRQDEINYTTKSGSATAIYDVAVMNHGLCLAICTEWKRVGNTLQLKWDQDLEGDEPKMRTIILTYKMKVV
jgi:hypothetical protein